VGLPNFHQGCNFAAACSITLPANAVSTSPFGFSVHVSQFLLFKTRVLELLAGIWKVNSNIPTEDYFLKGPYMFDIG
jgi:hypothetical protein